MALAATSSPSSDAVGLAILTALNITDEYFRARSRPDRAAPAPSPPGPRRSRRWSTRRSPSPNRVFHRLPRSASLRCLRKS